MGVEFTDFKKCVTFVKKVCHSKKRRYTHEWIKSAHSILKKFRQETGMSQKQFAEAIDLPTRTYRSYESGERGLTIEKFRNLKEKLGFHKDYEENILRARIDYVKNFIPIPTRSRKLL